MVFISFQNPQVDIPKGTFLAILISTISYIAVVWILGATGMREATGPLVYEFLSGQDLVNVTTTSQSIISSTVSMADQSEQTVNSIRNCSLAGGRVCKYGLLHDYQVSPIGK